MERENNPVLGVFWMFVTGLCFVAVTAIVKFIGSDVPAAQAGFVRYVMGLVILIPLFPHVFRAGIGRQDLRVFAIRGFLQAAGVVCWFFAMTQISISEVTAMNYLSPVYITIGAALFLGEKIAIRRILAVIVALLGMLIILRPGFREIGIGHIAMLFTAAFFAASYLLAKNLSNRFDARVIIVMLSVFTSIGLAPVALVVWVNPTSEQLAWIFLIAIFATAGHYTMTLAFRATSIVVTQPVTFLQLIWATLLGVFVFGEMIDGWVLLGGTTILAAVSFLTWREAMLRRATIAPPQEATKV